MLLRVSVITFLTAIFSLAYGIYSNHQSATDFGRVMIFLSVMFVLGSMLRATFVELSHDMRSNKPKPA